VPPSVKLVIKVVPGSSRNEVVGWLDDVLKVRVTAPPERGQANAAVIAILAKALRIPGGRVRIFRGHTSARKTLDISGLTESHINVRLQRPQ